MKQLPKKSSNHILLLAALLMVVLLLMFSLKRCKSSEAPEEETVASDTLRVAMQYAPGSFYYAGDSLTGVDYEALKSLQLPYKIYPITDPQQGLRGLDDGIYDVVVGDLPQTSELNGQYITTDPIYRDKQVLVQRAGVDSITSRLQLAGQTVVVPKDSPMASLIRNTEREIGADINIVERDATSERLLMELSLGVDSVPLVVVNKSVAEDMARDFPNLTFSVPLSLTQFQPWVLRADRPDLRDLINRHLK